MNIYVKKFSAFTNQKDRKKRKKKRHLERVRARDYI